MGSGQSISVKVRCGKHIQVARGRVASQRAKSRSLESFVLRIYIVGRLGVKKLHIDWQVKVVLGFLGGRDYPNLSSGGLLGQIFIELWTPFVHPVKQIRDRRQLIKVGAMTQSYLWVLSLSIRDSLWKQIVTRGRQLTKVVWWASSLGTVDPLLLFRPWDESTVSKAFLPI